MREQEEIPTGYPAVFRTGYVVMSVWSDVAGGAEVGGREPSATPECRQLRDADSAGHSAVAAQTGTLQR